MKINLVEYFERTANLFLQKLAIGGIRKHILSGNHSEIFLSPAVECSGNKTL